MAEDIVITGGIIITPLVKAKSSLDAVLKMDKTDITRDAAIQRFEFTFELAWKTLKRVLKHKGIIANNPRDVIREAAQQGLIDHVESWFTFLENRNLTTHVYNEKVADKIYSSLPDFNHELDNLLTVIR